MNILIVCKSFCNHKRWVPLTIFVLCRMNRINTNGYPVFTTYSLQDQEKVRYIVEMMTSILGIRVFDPENDVQPGESIIRKIIENGIEKSKASVLFISKNFLKSGLCKFIADNILWRYIITKGKYRVIPIVLDKCKVPRSFRVLNCIYCWKYELKVQKYNATVLDCLVQLKRRFIKALKGIWESSKINQSVVSLP